MCVNSTFYKLSIHENMELEMGELWEFHLVTFGPQKFIVPKQAISTSTVTQL